GGSSPKPPPAPVMPDITDQAVRAAKMRENTTSLFGSRRASMLTGPLGDRSRIPLYSKSILGD
ncbi:MAG TPA: hypothetical protein VIY48_01660, partial [Candidatus Paceibacterota bacterium]